MYGRHQSLVWQGVVSCAGALGHLDGNQQPQRNGHPSQILQAPPAAQHSPSPGRVRPLVPRRGRRSSFAARTITDETKGASALLPGSRTNLCRVRTDLASNLWISRWQFLSSSSVRGFAGHCDPRHARYPPARYPPPRRHGRLDGPRAKKRDPGVWRQFLYLDT